MAQASKTLSAVSTEIAGAVEITADAVVSVHGGYRRPSSGVVWREGVVVTAAHTIRREEEIEIVLADGARVTGELAGMDTGTDLAVLKVATARSAAPERTELGALKVGQLAIAVARVSEHSVNASLGMIGGLGGAWRTWRGGRIEQLIRVAIALYPGFSGGALLDAQGRMIGMNTAGLARSGGIAIPHDAVDRVTAELLARGYIARPYLGVAMQSVRLPESLRKKLGLDDGGGAIVLGMEAEGPAESAGVMVGDVFVHLGGQRVSDAVEVRHALGTHSVAGAVPARIVRGGEVVALDIVTRERPRRSR